MSFVVGEVDVSPDSTKNIASQVVNPLSNQLQKLATQVGQRYVLLDSVRDASFLSSTSIVNPDGSHDGGLGVVDNGLFVYTTRFTPGSPTVPRPYPVKFFWIGSPKGTNDANDNFSIYVADVNQDAFFPGAQASAWLVNPRLVLHWTQAKSDIVSWFDSNYPGGAMGGIGLSNSGSNSSYGTLIGGSSAVGNVTSMNSIDGQFWPIYDYVDDSLLIYFSWKTPNQNTLSLYCYKITDSEVGSPASTPQFQGGLSQAGWIGNLNNNGNTNNTLSSHRFSILSPDPLVSTRTTGMQSAVFAYSWGVFDGSTPDHGVNKGCSIVSDIHGAPTNPGVFQGGSFAVNLDQRMAVVDKLGSIHVTPFTEGVTQGYAVLYNSPSQRDIRSNVSNAVVISSMQIQLLYTNPITETVVATGPALLSRNETAQLGLCRPSFTTLPDGLAKIVYANFTMDQYLNIGYEYVRSDELYPKYRNKLLYTFLPNSASMLDLFGRKNLVIRWISAGSNPLSSPANPVHAFIEASGADVGSGLSGYFNVWRSLRHYFQQSTVGLSSSGLLNGLGIILFKGLNAAGVILNQGGANVSGLSTAEPTDDDLDVPDSIIDYLTVTGKKLTPNNTIVESGLNSGALMTTTLTDWVSTDDYKELTLKFIISTVGGTSPTLTINFLTLDPVEGQTALTLKLNNTAISTSNHQIILVIANGIAATWIDGVATVLGNFAVPTLWQIQFVIGGISPSFAIESTYEARK
jgi:hypothetical protein